MKKWIIGLFTVSFVSYAGYAAYDYYKAGYFTLPDMPDGAFSISYKNGLRAILVDIPNERGTRHYLGFPADVPDNLEKVWAFCTPPNGDELAALERQDWSEWPEKRFEAICKIDVDGEAVVRGTILSVPRL